MEVSLRGHPEMSTFFTYEMYKLEVMSHNFFTPCGASPFNHAISLQNALNHVEFRLTILQNHAGANLEYGAVKTRTFDSIPYS